MQYHERLRVEALNNIRNLQNRFTAELLAVVLFILISIGAMVDFAFLPSLPDNIRAMLGRPPSGNMIGAALILYVFSAIILILSRMMTGSGKHGAINHVGYLAGFYFFYHFSGKLPENFWAVFVAGVTVMGLDAYHLWIYCSEELEKEKGRLANLNRKPADHGEEES